MIHELKTLPVYWDAVGRGDKTFEVRRDDRGFQKGDIVKLLRHNGTHTVPTVAGASVITYKIGWVMTGGQFGIQPGYVVFSLEAME